MNSEFVYNGIEIEKYPFQANKGDRLLYVGRFDRFKQPHVAIEIAKRLEMGLDLVGGTFVNDRAYLEQIKQACDGKQITFNPDVSQETKINFMKNAKCLLFPSAMGEPFGLVMIENLCVGTPVIALKDGAIPELMEEGKVGWSCNNQEEMINAIMNVQKISPSNCRKHAEKFSRENMALEYEKLYRRILSGDEW
jgi:glycosyltransferase involved in cell wall biosynthesis